MMLMLLFEVQIRLVCLLDTCSSMEICSSASSVFFLMFECHTYPLGDIRSVHETPQSGEQ